MIHFEFTLFSKKHSKDTLLDKYTLEYLNDWLSHESEIKYLFYFENNITDEFSNIDCPDSINDSIIILRHNNILNNDEKNYILSIYIEDAYVINRDNKAIFHLILSSDYKKQLENEKIIKFLCNHIYNQIQYGIIKNGIVQPLNENEKLIYKWSDEIDWTNKFVENNINLNDLDFLYLTEFSYVYQSNSLIKTLNKPIYLSNYNLECFRLSKIIDSIDNDIDRYKKSIKFLENKKKELRKNKKELYVEYRNVYINMLSDHDKSWNECLKNEDFNVESPKNKLVQTN